MWLRKEKGGASVGPHEWPEDGSACEVPEELGRALLRIPDGGYSVAGDPAAEPADESGNEDPGGDDGQPPAKAPARRGKTTT